MRGPKTTKHKNITRIDHPAKRTFGYNVRVAWQGQTYGKFFSDRVHGDRLAALAAAIEWRDAKEKEVGDGSQALGLGLQTVPPHRRLITTGVFGDHDAGC
jgi:hypothetical protein